MRILSRREKIRKFGIDIVEYDEKLWQERGFKIDYNTGLLKKDNLIESIVLK